ncbi:MAG: DUF1499 domain-containing protein [Pseudomonadota bacterium]
MRLLKIMTTLAIVLLGLVAAAVICGQMGLLAGRRPADLGPHEGRLKPPSTTPNSVSSQAMLYPEHPQRAYARIEPLRFSGDGRAAMQRLARVLSDTQRTTLIRNEPTYLYAEVTTPLLKFTDDVEFLLDESQGVIHVRSASRIGRGDLGVNRKRIEEIRTRFAAAASTSF